MTGHYLVATAGHVDHGKTTLVQALTGHNADRWAEERERGLTIDLGFADCPLPDGGRLSFVDVPGHERFLNNMLAGVGPASAVCLVVAADEGWRAQTQQHLRAIDAWGIRHAVVALTRCDLLTDHPDDAATDHPDGADGPADVAPIPAAVAERIEQCRQELAGTTIATAPIVPVSARTGAGLPQLRQTLADVVRAAAAEEPQRQRVRVWIDRSFTIAGAGTVITGTLAAGSLHQGEQAFLVTTASPAAQRVRLRSLQQHGCNSEQATAATRVAVNLVPAEGKITAQEIHRGDSLIAGLPATQPPELVSEVDVICPAQAAGLPLNPLAHIGTAALSVRFRLLATPAVSQQEWVAARLRLAHPLPLEVGDRLLLRDAGDDSQLSYAVVADTSPVEFHRRGAARRRAETLLHVANNTGLPRWGEDHYLAAAVTSRGYYSVAAAQAAGFAAKAWVQLGVTQSAGATLVQAGDYLLPAATAELLQEQVLELLAGHAAKNPLNPWLSQTAITQATLPAGRFPQPVLAAIVQYLVHTQKLVDTPQGVALPDADPHKALAAHPGMARLLAQLDAEPFHAPEADQLRDWGLSSKELAAAAQAGLLLRLAETVLLSPRSPALAMRHLAQLPQPFTTSAARQALGTTRRVAIPLLEYLDRRGWTVQTSPGQRHIKR